MLSTHCDEVTMVKVIECGSGITIDGCSVRIALVTVRRHVTTTENGIMNMDTTFHRVSGIHFAIQIVTCIQLGPISSPIAILLCFRKCVQVIRLKIFILSLGLAVNRSTIRISYLEPR